MRNRLRRLLAVLAIAIVAMPATLAMSSPAAASVGQETFGCRIAPGTVFSWQSHCVNTVPASTYSVAFSVVNPAASYTYSWTIQGSFQSVITGCTSTSSACAVSVSGGGDAFIVGTVTYTHNGQSFTKQATAVIRAFCGSVLC